MTTHSPFPQPRLIVDAEALRGHLDALNEDGQHPVAVGWDARSVPFLITLVGPYVESEDVIFDSPWQTDADWGKPPRCDECSAQACYMDDLRFPVTVLA